MPVTPIEHYMVGKPENSEQSLIDKKLEKIEEEAEVLDWDDEESVEEVIEETIIPENNVDDFEEMVINVEVDDPDEEFEEITLNVNVVDEEISPINIVEPSPLEERLYPSDIGFEPPMVYPAEEEPVVSIEDVPSSEVVAEENYDFAVPEIFKIIERDGVEVDEDVK